MSIAATVDAMESFTLLPDPQTNGGLLFAVKSDAVETVQQLLKEQGLEAFIQPIGSFIPKGEKVIQVNL